MSVNAPRASHVAYLSSLLVGGARILLRSAAVFDLVRRTTGPRRLPKDLFPGQSRCPAWRGYNSHFSLLKACTHPLLSGARTQVQTHTWTEMAGRRVPSAQNANYKRRGAGALASMHNTDALVSGARTQVLTSPWTTIIGMSLPRYRWASYSTG